MQVLRRRLDLIGFMLLVSVPAMLVLMTAFTTVRSPSVTSVQSNLQQVTCVPIARPRTHLAKYI